MTRDEEIARTILAQLGGARFVAMTGARSLASGGGTLSFRLPARMTKGRGSAMRIALTPTDEYRLELLRMERFEVVIVDERDGVQVGELARVFTDMTGLDTTLGAAA